MRNDPDLKSCLVLTNTQSVNCDLLVLFFDCSPIKQIIVRPSRGADGNHSLKEPVEENILSNPWKVLSLANGAKGAAMLCVCFCKGGGHH